MHPILFLSKSLIKATWANISGVVLGHKDPTKQIQIQDLSPRSNYLRSGGQLAGILKFALQVVRVLFSFGARWPIGFLIGAKASF